MDRVGLVVEHGSGAQVGLRHPEGPFHLEQVVVGGHDLPAGQAQGGDVGDVTLQPGELAGPVHEDLIDGGAGAGQFHEPVLAQRLLPVGDLLRLLDLLVQGVVVAPVPFRGVVVDHPPLARVLTHPHDPLGLHRLPVVEDPAVSVEVLREVIRGLADPGPHDEGEPGVLELVQIRRGEHARIGDDHDIIDPVTGLEGAQHGQQGEGLTGVPRELVDLQREPAGGHEHPDEDLRVDAAFLAHGDVPLCGGESRHRAGSAVLIMPR